MSVHTFCKISSRFLYSLRHSILLLIFASGALYSQQSLPDAYEQMLVTRGELYFRFCCSRPDMERISGILSIDRVSRDTVYAYANRKEFECFLRENLPYTILKSPSLLLDEKDVTTGIVTKDWDVYPTYDAYVALMNDFETNHPGLCQVHEIGTSVNGRKLLCVKLSDNVGSKEPEPEFFFTSTMHGDEVTGYMLLLRLIDYLLTNYELMPEVKHLVDNMEIWINPNANPDGTYYSGNHTVSGAIRYNANFIDLNRNFRDPDEGDHPDGNLWQPETVAMMQFMEDHHFVFSANYHGGAEVLNYPWDTWSRPHPDENWFEYVSTCYADTVKGYGGSSYFSSVESDGVINGYDWYPIAGGRQDFTTFYCNGREITIEVSLTKMPAAASLPTYWEYNYIAMQNYIGQCLNGIHGIVTDSVTGTPLEAKITVLNHDEDSSHVYTEPLNGDYHRLIGPGTYDIMCSSPGYINKTEHDVVLEQYTSSLSLNFELRSGINPPEYKGNDSSDRPDCWFGMDKQIHFSLHRPENVTIELFTTGGKLLGRISYPAPAGYSGFAPGTIVTEKGIYLCRIVFGTTGSAVLKIQL